MKEGLCSLLWCERTIAFFAQQFQSRTCHSVKIRATVQARGWGEHWIILLHGDFAADIVSEAKDAVRWQKHEDLSLLENLANTWMRKNCEPHRYAAFFLSAKAHLIISEYQNHSFRTHSHFQGPVVKIKFSDSSRISYFSELQPSNAFPNDRGFIPSWFPAVPKQAEPCQT